MSTHNIWRPPGTPIDRPSKAQWIKLLNEDGGLKGIQNPYEFQDRSYRLALSKALVTNGFDYAGRICMSGRIVPLLGMDYFPSRWPVFSVHDADAQQRGVTVHHLSPPYKALDWISSSIGLQTPPACLQARPRWKRQSFVACLEQGQCVSTPWGYAIFDRNRHYAVDFCSNDGPMIAMSGQLPPNGYRLKGTVAIFQHFCSFGVYHWMMETLPRFKLLELADQLSQVDYFAMREVMPWQWEFIDLLGIPREKCINFANVAHIQADRLLVCSNVEDADFSILPGYLEPEPWVTDYVAELGRLTGQHHRSPPKDRVYISRRRAWARQVENGDELETLLSRRGFKTVYFEDMTFAEKAACLGQAEIVVSPTGAGLTNVPLMQPGSKCIVLYCDDEVYAAKNAICANSGVIHCHLISHPHSRYFPEKSREIPEHMREIRVDLQGLNELLDYMGF